MKLKEYYQQVRNIKTSDLQKMQIYEAFLHKSTIRPSLLLRYSFYMKVGVLTLFFVVIGLSCLNYINFNNENIINNQKAFEYTYLGTGVIIEKPINQVIQKNAIAHADYLGKIIETKGEVKILQNGLETQTDFIGEGDTVLLVNTASLKFQVNSGVVALIEGPAKFEIRYGGERNGTKNYIINLLEGDYVEIRSEDNFVTKQDNIIVQANDIEIETKNITKKIDFKISKKDNKKIIENKGGELVLKKVVNNDKKYSALETNQKAQIDKDVKLLKEITTIQQEVKEKSITNTYSINSISQSEIKGEKEMFETNVKQILPTDKLNEFKDILMQNFIQKDTENIIYYYFSGNKNAFEISKNNLLVRIQNIYQLFNFDIESEVLQYKIKNQSVNIEDIYLLVDQLLAKINNNYYVPTKYINRLKTLLAWLIILKDNQFGKYNNINTRLDMEYIITNLNLIKNKNNLIFE